MLAAFSKPAAASRDTRCASERIDLAIDVTQTRRRHPAMPISTSHSTPRQPRGAGSAEVRGVNVRAVRRARRRARGAYAAKRLTATR